MNASRAKRIERLFQDALDLPADERAAHIRQRADDLDMEREVEELIAAFEANADFLDAPAATITTAETGPPERIGAYDVLREIGRGGMGVVYAARDPRLEREVALKVLAPIVELDSTWREQFRREARLLAAINHHNIATVHSLEEIDGRNVITMELVGGDLLTAHVADGPMPLDRCLHIGQQIAAALEAAHRRDVIHRDLKPLNIMINEDELVKVLDFGLAKRIGPGGKSAIDASTIDLGTGDVAAGTPGYMSPEQVRGEVVDRRTDIWSFGCVLFECLSGARAVGGTDVPTRLTETLEGEPNWDAIPHDVPDSLVRLLRRCLRREAADRLDSIAIARRELEELAAVREVRRRTRPAVTDAGTPSNLPTPLTSFVGRTAELGRVAHQLKSHHVVTLVGAGGCGKSRLATEVARAAMADYPDGVWLVELAPIEDPATIDIAVAAAMRLRIGPETSPRTAILDHFPHRRVLLVLDNCEHVLEAAGDLVHEITRACESARVLTTSREPLSVTGEAVFPVSTLKEEAVDLFVDRATAVAPHFALTEKSTPTVRAICARLDGIPLAIELAAARTTVLSVEEIASRLDDRFRLLTAGSTTRLPHHRTLHALIAWSYDLLDEPERRFFARLSSFVGSFSLHAAEAVAAGDDFEPWETLDLVSRLVNKSLIEVVTGAEEGRLRYRLLDTVRAYAADTLVDLEQTRERYFRFYDGLAVRLGEEMSGASEDQMRALAAFATDHGNLMQAVELGLESSPMRPETVRIANEIITYGNTSGRVHHTSVRLTEARDLGERLLARPELQHAPRSDYGHLLHRLGTVACNQRDYDRSDELLSHAFEVWAGARGSSRRGRRPEQPRARGPAIGPP